MNVPVYLEIGSKKVFACAVEWPGWGRAGRDEASALAALETYLPRYARVARRARISFVKAPIEFDVVERVKGSGTTDFGAPGSVPKVDHEPIDLKERQRLARLVRACWDEFDAAAEAAPSVLPKGPRGGGRDRDKVIKHLIDAEAVYGRSIGVKGSELQIDDKNGIAGHRDELLEALKSHPGEGKWPIPYAARRIAWHILDHAWELEDKSKPATSEK